MVEKHYRGVRTDTRHAACCVKVYAIGAILISPDGSRPFTEKQIKLLETFADQAVIAIENVRLFKELQERNAELREALEHQTATSEVLGIISRSPTDVQPVLDAIAESAARVCGIDDVLLRLREGNAMILRAHFGPMRLAPRDQHGSTISLDARAWHSTHSGRSRSKRPPDLGLTSALAPSWPFLFVSKESSLEDLIARRNEVRPFPGADQAAWRPSQIRL